MRGKMDCFGVSDVGRQRPVNEDQFLLADLNKSMFIHQTSLSHEDQARLSVARKASCCSSPRA